MTRPLLTVGILAYNRADLLPGILDSIIAQDFTDYECVVAEDASAESEALRAIVERYAAAHPGRFRFHRNERTLGFDGNLRRLIEISTGQYVFLMGNDDYVCPGAFRAVAEAIATHGEIGAILRAYTAFREDPAVIVQRGRYSSSAQLIPAGRAAVLACYRRFVPLSGIVLHRDAAAAAASTAVDGYLFYQQWLAANILRTKPLLSLPNFLAHIKLGSVSEFGSSDIERGRYAPGTRDVQQHLRVVEGLFMVADALEKHQGDAGLGADIRSEFARHCFYTLAYFAGYGRRALWRGYRGLSALGLGRFASLHLWFIAVFTFGVGPLHWAIARARALLGYTPSFSSARP